jgi:hypothetical protein
MEALDSTANDTSVAEIILVEKDVDNAEDSLSIRTRD